MTEFIINHLKEAEHRDWVMLRSSLRRAIMTKELQMPSLVEVGILYVGFFVFLHLAQVVPYVLRKTPGKVWGFFQYDFFPILSWAKSIG